MKKSSNNQTKKVKLSKEESKNEVSKLLVILNQDGHAPIKHLSKLCKTPQEVIDALKAAARHLMVFWTEDFERAINSDKTLVLGDYEKDIYIIVILPNVAAYPSNKTQWNDVLSYAKSEAEIIYLTSLVN